MFSSSTIRGTMELKSVVNKLWRNSVTTNTRQVYDTGFMTYIRFLLLSGIVNYFLPDYRNVVVSEELLLLFVAFCYSKLQISYSTVKLYLCGIRFRCLEINVKYPEINELGHLKTLLNGFKRLHNSKPKPRYPITFDILERICILLRKKETYENLLLETMCTLAFFAFLRCGEFTIDCADKFDPVFHLCLADLLIFDDCVHLKLKASKTDPFRQGITIKLFETKRCICPYSVCCRYFSQRVKLNSQPESPLFLEHSGTVVTRNKFLSLLKFHMDILGYDSSLYSGHSFRIGAATTSGAVRIEDHLIKVLGRWSSDTYCRYIRISNNALQNAQSKLAGYKCK